LFEGWDFSDIERRMRTIGEKWDFLELVREHLTTDTVLLDMGTGGGEKLLGLAGLVKKAYGIDILQSMIDTAKKNQARLNIANVEFRLPWLCHIPNAL
jgi:2-polyprenyl-3-methyl-5-hydroxy-6-metoxy-1,4-benzoquinol methylase